MTADEVLSRMTDYERGFIDGVHSYSWWKDGTLYVGTTGRTYQEAVCNFLVSRGYAREDVEAISW